MAKFEFKKNEKKKPRPISETKISKPKETYDPIAITNEVEHDIKEEKPKKRRGRPKTGRKNYTTVRLMQSTVIKINALENALGIKTQDETVDQALDRVINSLTSDEKRGMNYGLRCLKRRRISEMQVETKIMQVVRSVLSHFGNKYIDTNGTLKRNKVIEDLDHYDKDLMSALLANKMIHDQYTKKIADTVVFELNKFIDVFEYKNSGKIVLPNTLIELV